MSATTDFYLARAAENARAAAETNLINVRERCLRAEAAWRQMADRLLHVERMKSHAAAVKSTAADASATDIAWPLSRRAISIKSSD